MALGHFFYFAPGVGSAPGGTAPVVTDPGTIVGTGHVDDEHSVLGYTVSGDPAPSLTYQWKRNGSDIGGATSATYTTVEDDQNTNLTCEITADNGVGSPAVSTTASYPISTSRWAPTAADQSINRASSW